MAVQSPVAEAASVTGSDVSEGGDLQIEAASLCVSELGSGDAGE